MQDRTHRTSICKEDQAIFVQSSDLVLCKNSFTLFGSSDKNIFQKTLINLGLLIISLSGSNIRVAPGYMYLH
jgi:hypothetical protein